MNSKTQAQKGFKTFILTLAISLAVFSGIYYVINNNNSEENTPQQTATGNNQESVLDASVGAAENPEATAGETQDNSTDQKDNSVFEKLANSKMNSDESPTVAGVSQEKAVLAGADQNIATETSQSTVPVTGISGPTVGIILTLVILSLVAYIYFVGPRKMALSSFEKDLLDDLD